MMRNSAGSSGGSGATEADCSEVLNLLSPLIQEYEQSEGSKKPAQNAIGQLKTLEENLTKKSFSGNVVNQLKALLQHIEQNNIGGANSCIKVLTTQHWAEVKDWVNAFKVVV
jgi:hypothetical protein